MRKTAVITGGSRGIGRALSLKLGELGYDTVINYSSPASRKAAEETAEQMEKDYGVRTLTVQADVSRYEECARLVDETARFSGDRIDALVNNAGISPDSCWTSVSPETYQRVIAVNLLSYMHMSHLVLPYMLNHSSREEQCIICNTSSVRGMTGAVNHADYCASKAGVIGFSRALALEYAPKGIRVNTIAPGVTMTDMLRAMGEEKLEKLVDTVPLGRIGEVSDIADAMEYIFRATFLTGQVISPNGGTYLP